MPKNQDLIPQELIQKRSYEIWQQEGRPDGLALEHWLRAKAELEAVFSANRRIFNIGGNFVPPRPHVTFPPRRSTARRASASEKVKPL